MITTIVLHTILFNIALELGADLKVIRNDELSLEQIIALNPSKIIISPGPATPNESEFV